MKARPQSAPSVMIAAGMNRSIAEFGRGVPVKPQRVLKRPATFKQGAGALAAGVLEAARLVNHQEVEQRVIVRNGDELVDQPGHEVDADHRDFALGRRGEERPPALRVSVQDCDAQMPKVRPGRDLLRPYGRRDQLRSYYKRVPAVFVAHEVGECRERGSALAGAERRDEKGGIGSHIRTSRLAAGSCAGRGARSWLSP